MPITDSSLSRMPKLREKHEVISVFSLQLHISSSRALSVPVVYLQVHFDYKQHILNTTNKTHWLGGERPFALVCFSKC